MTEVMDTMFEGKQKKRNIHVCMMYFVYFMYFNLC